MEAFLQRFARFVTGVLSGWDRVRFRGTKRLLSHSGGMVWFLGQQNILRKDFKAYALDSTRLIYAATEELAERAGGPVIYLASSNECKEERALKVRRARHIEAGLICVISCVESCYSYEFRRNPETQQVDMVLAPKKCLHYYFYQQHPKWGFMNVRLQTHFPFNVNVHINGREWLAQQMDAAGLNYVRRDNCFTRLQHLDQAQALFDQQQHTDWAAVLNALIAQVHPADTQILKNCPVPYYWSFDESEWASDLMFKSARALGQVYPHFVHLAMEHMSCVDVMRYFRGRVQPQDLARFRGEAVTDLAHCNEGVRTRHRLNRNWIKMYDKTPLLLRVETVLNYVRPFKVYRPKEGEPNGPLAWRYMRKGVADVHRRAQLCQAANNRYAQALASVDTPHPLSELTEKLCRRIKWKGAYARAINPFGAEDTALLKAVANGKFLIEGFRNADLRQLLLGAAPEDTVLLRRQSAAITRKIRLLRAHGLIHKVPKSNRYLVSPNGRNTLTAVLAAREADPKKLIRAA